MVGSNAAIEVVVPLISPLVITFDVVDGSDTVEAADGENHVVDDFDGEVRARVIHVRYRRPCVAQWVVHLTAAHSRDSIEPAYYVNL